RPPLSPLFPYTTLFRSVVAHQQHAANVYQAVLLGADGRAVSQVEHLAGNVVCSAVLLARLALLDEVSILGKSAGVEEKWDAVLRSEEHTSELQSRFDLV